MTELDELASRCHDLPARRWLRRMAIMQFETGASGWLADVHRCPSPNFNERPAGCVPELLVVHNISLPPGQFGTGEIDALFCNRLDCTAHPFYLELVDLRVSAHFLIERCGSVTQFVSREDRAWHAGVSEWRSRRDCNNFSIGIELEGTDYLPFEPAQYDVLAALATTILAEYPQIREDSIVGHSDIAPGRKTDPGPAFDWSGFRDRLMSRRARPTPLLNEVPR